MDKIYFTITGTNYRYGTELFEKGDRVMLKKEGSSRIFVGLQSKSK